MTKFLLIGGAVLAAAVAALAFVVKAQRDKAKDLEERLNAAEAAKEKWKAQSERLAGMVDELAKNRSEANERIDNLYSGDAVDNAIGVLSKPKG